jgi:hypothetical protein
LEAIPDAEETFAFFKKNDIKIGLDTGFFSDITNAIIEQLGWLKNGLVDYVISSDETAEGRPHPYMIQELMKRADVTDPKKVIKIGDTEVDIKEGRNAGCLLTIACYNGEILFKRTIGIIASLILLSIVYRSCPHCFKQVACLFQQNGKINWKECPHGSSASMLRYVPFVCIFCMYAFRKPFYCCGF